MDEMGIGEELDEVIEPEPEPEAESKLEDTVKMLLSDDRYDQLVPIYLAAAKEAILGRRYPMDPSKTWEDTEGRFDMKACMIAVQLINKRGAEGEVGHEENGTKRTYRGADVPPEMLRGIIPFVGVPR